MSGHVIFFADFSKSRNGYSTHVDAHLIPNGRTCHPNLYNHYLAADGKAHQLRLELARAEQAHGFMNSWISNVKVLKVWHFAHKCPNHS